MKKEYDFWANKQNTPHLDLYTRLIKQICGYTSLNFLLAFRDCEKKSVKVNSN